MVYGQAACWASGALAVVILGVVVVMILYLLETHHQNRRSN